eukprot:5095493-Lingulodinium_polyedra.AAC.1
MARRADAEQQSSQHVGEAVSPEAFAVLDARQPWEHGPPIIVPRQVRWMRPIAAEGRPKCRPS